MKRYTGRCIGGPYDGKDFVNLNPRVKVELFDLYKGIVGTGIYVHQVAWWLWNGTGSGQQTGKPDGSKIRSGRTETPKS